MAWRFADLPVRSKFLITLGIPVLGLVLLIGKQVDSSIKRRNVLRYINVQSRNVKLLSGALNELQSESALNLAYLLGLENNRPRLQVQYALFGHVSIFGGVGYTAGHDTVASARIGYAVNSEPPISIHSSTQGGTYFWQAGLKLQVPVRNRARDK